MYVDPSRPAGEPAQNEAEEVASATGVGLTVGKACPERSGTGCHGAALTGGVERGKGHDWHTFRTLVDVLI